MKVSAGLILTNGKQLLLGHTTGQKQYDIPKGGVDLDETPLEACIREAEEETGLYVDASSLRDLGEFDYNPQKRLHLFLLVTDNLPDLDVLKCSSTFIDSNGQEKPELDGFIYADFDSVDKYCVKNMTRVLTSVYGIIER